MNLSALFVEMLNSKARRLFDAVTALFFMAVATLLVVFAGQVQLYDGNYVAFYLGFGVWLECVYLAVHFGLAATLISRSKLAEKISQILGVLVLLPLGLIIFILTVLLEQSIRTNVRHESEVTIMNWVFASLILILLVAPSVLICRKIVCSFLDRRAEQAFERDIGGTIE